MARNFCTFFFGQQIVAFAFNHGHNWRNTKQNVVISILLLLRDISVSVAVGECFGEREMRVVFIRALRYKGLLNIPRHRWIQFVSTNKSYNKDCRFQAISLSSRTLKAETSVFDADVSSFFFVTRKSSFVLKNTFSACEFQVVGLSSLAELKKNLQFWDLWLIY